MNKQNLSIVKLSEKKSPQHSRTAVSAVGAAEVFVQTGTFSLFPGNARLSTLQRQSIASGIGTEHGNQYLNKALGMLKSNRVIAPSSYLIQRSEETYVTHDPLGCSIDSGDLAAFPESFRRMCNRRAQGAALTRRMAQAQEKGNRVIRQIKRVDSAQVSLYYEVIPHAEPLTLETTVDVNGVNIPIKGATQQELSQIRSALAYVPQQHLQAFLQTRNRIVIVDWTGSRAESSPYHRLSGGANMPANQPRTRRGITEAGARIEITHTAMTEHADLTILHEVAHGIQAFRSNPPYIPRVVKGHYGDSIHQGSNEQPAYAYMWYLINPSKLNEHPEDKHALDRAFAAHGITKPQNSGNAPNTEIQRQIINVLQLTDASNMKTFNIQRHQNHNGLTTQQKYEHTLTHAGTTKQTWRAGIKNATFLGVTIRRGIHQELIDRLKLAEDHIRSQDKFHGQDDAIIAKTIGLYSISGVRPPKEAVGGAKVSNHAYGIAIDVNHMGNPFLGQKGVTTFRIIKRATALVLGHEIDLSGEQRGSIEEIRERYEEASNAFKVYFSLQNDLDNLKQLLTARGRPTDPSTVTREQSRIRHDCSDSKLLADFATEPKSPPRNPALGVMDLSKELIEALVGHAGLYWGGQYPKPGDGKDLMHFDWRGGTIQDSYRV